MTRPLALATVNPASGLTVERLADMDGRYVVVRWPDGFVVRLADDERPWAAPRDLGAVLRAAVEQRAACEAGPAAFEALAAVEAVRDGGA